MGTSKSSTGPGSGIPMRPRGFPILRRRPTATTPTLTVTLRTSRHNPRRRHRTAAGTHCTTWSLRCRAHQP